MKNILCSLHRMERKNDFIYYSIFIEFFLISPQIYLYSFLSYLIYSYTLLAGKYSIL